MKSKRFVLPLVFVVFLSIQPNVLAKDVWTRVESGNFTLIGNSKEKNIRNVGKKLEQFRHVFAQLFPALNTTSPVPTKVIVFKNEKSFKKFKSTKWAAGYFQPGSDVNYIALHTGGEKQQTYTTIFHEYIHFLVNNNLGRSKVPAWFNEGIAEYYDQFAIKDDQVVTLGALNNNHLFSLSRSKLIPFETYFKIDHYSLSQQGTHGANIFYAQSWAFMHFLIQSNGGARQAQLGKFLDLLTLGNAREAAFTAAFKSDYKTMESELKKYIEQRTYKTSVVKFRDKLIFEDAMTTFPISEADAKGYQGDLLYHIRKYDEAEKYLNEALAIDPNNGIANTAMGLVLVRKQKFDIAKSHLEKAVNASNANFLTYYQHAYVITRMGGFGGEISDADAEIARKSINRSIALNSNYAPNYDLYAYISMIRDENLDEGITFLKRGLKISPGNETYMLNLANLYLRKNEYKNAIAIVDIVFKTTSEPQIRNYASRLLNRLREVETQMSDYESRRRAVRNGDRTQAPTLGRRGAPPPSGGDNPGQAGESAATEAYYLNQAVNESLRKPLDGETRIFGSLSMIKCSDDYVTYSFKTADGLIKLQSVDFQVIEMTQMNVDLGDFQVGCGSIKKDYRVVFTYRRFKEPKKGSIGTLVALEFVSKDFVLLAP